VLAAGVLLLASGLGVLVVRQALALLGRAPLVVVSRAEPGVIASSPGGVGIAGPAPGQAFAVSLHLNGLNQAVSVEQVDVVNGSEVAAGAPLLTLDPLPIEQHATAVALQLAQAQDALAGARAALAATLRDNPAYGYLDVQVPLLQGNVAIDEQLLQIAHGNTATIRAPFAGTVTGLHVQPGDSVHDGQTVLQLVRTGELLVSAGVQLADLAEISPGDRVDLSLAAVAGVALTGTVLTVSPQAAADGLEGTVTVLVRNDGRQPVPLGAQFFVRIIAPVRAAVSVPALAVFNLELDPAVYVVSRGRAHRQRVVVGANDGNRIQILSGLRPGAQVALSNTQTLVDGEQVRTETEHG
jgi:RND family efflux transporter MFP subunit